MPQLTDKGILLKIKVIPNSSKNDIMVEDEFVRVKVTALPIENKANKALVEFLSKLLKVPKSKFKIIKGEISKEKTLLIEIEDDEKKTNIMSILSKKEGVI